MRQACAGPGGLCVLTGAGMSAESGIPTFRDAMSGLWSRFDPAQLASEEGFRADPARVWAWYAERKQGVRDAQPNAGHVALADYGRRRPGVLTIVTQNVDDLHQRAGWPQTIRLHGDILADRWLEACPRGLGCAIAHARPGEPPACADCCMICWACEMALPTMPFLIGIGKSAIGVGATPHGCSPAGSKISRIQADAARHFTSVSGAHTMFMPPSTSCICACCAAL